MYYHKREFCGLSSTHLALELFAGRLSLGHELIRWGERAETKNTWARDDPAMLLLISLCLFGQFLLLPVSP